MADDYLVTLTRPSWDEWGLLVARAISTRADCRRRQVGAVILDSSHRVIGAGYNGFPPGEPGCLAGACPRAFTDVAPNSSYDTGPGTCKAIHAEINAIIDCGRERLAGSTLYCTEVPCLGCAKIIAGFGLHVVCPDSTSNPEIQ